MEQNEDYAILQGFFSMFFMLPKYEDKLGQYFT